MYIPENAHSAGSESPKHSMPKDHRYIRAGARLNPETSKAAPAEAMINHLIGSL
jgi:hypothetical protein